MAVDVKPGGEAVGAIQPAVEVSAVGDMTVMRAPILRFHNINIALPRLVVWGTDEAGNPVYLLGEAEVEAVAGAILDAIEQRPTVEEQLAKLPPGAKVRRIIRDQ